MNNVFRESFPKSKFLSDIIIHNMPKIIYDITLAETYGSNINSLFAYMKEREHAGKILTGAIAVIEYAEILRCWDALFLKLKGNRLLLKANASLFKHFFKFEKDKKRAYFERDNNFYYEKNSVVNTHLPILKSKAVGLNDTESSLLALAIIFIIHEDEYKTLLNYSGGLLIKGEWNDDILEKMKQIFRKKIQSTPLTKTGVERVAKQVECFLERLLMTGGKGIKEVYEGFHALSYKSLDPTESRYYEVSHAMFSTRIFAAKYFEEMPNFNALEKEVFNGTLTKYSRGWSETPHDPREILLDLNMKEFKRYFSDIILFAEKKGIWDDIKSSNNPLRKLATYS